MDRSSMWGCRRDRHKHRRLGSPGQGTPKLTVSRPRNTVPTNLRAGAPEETILTSFDDAIAGRSLGVGCGKEELW